MKNMITTRLKSMALALFALAAIPLFGKTYTYNNMTWSDSFSLGKWTCRYNDAKAYAKNHNTPMIVVWANPGCGYCQTFENNIGPNSTVKTWAEDREYVMVFVLGSSANSDYGLSAKDASDAFAFCTKLNSGEYPMVGIWWPKNKKTGKEVKVGFTGRAGKMAITSGNFAKQFMDSVDYYVGDYADVKPQSFTVTFNANGGTIAAEEKTRKVVAGKTIGTFPTTTRTGYKLTGWATAASGGTAVKTTTKIMGNATYYAQWKKAVTLTLKDSPVGEGKLIGEGQYDEGTTVAVKTAPKNGGIFQCWKDGSGKIVSDIPKFKYTLGSSDVTLTAYFTTKQEDADSMKLVVNSATMNELTVRKTTIRQGLSINWAVNATALTATTPSVSGLPAGLKLVKDKTTNKYSIKGVATTLSKVDKNGNVKPSSVTVTVKTSGGNKKTYKWEITVVARPAYTEGVFNGFVDSAADAGVPAGLVYNLTVAANGKISGKLLNDGKTYTLSAPSLVLQGGEFMATITGKAGKEEKVWMSVKFASKTKDGYTYGYMSAGKSWYAWQTPWKTNDKLKALAKVLAKAKPLTLPGELDSYGDLTLKFGANGVVTVKGGGVSSSSVLVPFSDEPKEFSLFPYLAPKKAFPGYAARLYLKWDGTNFSPL